jgi:hypothetical protein
MVRKLMIALATLVAALTTLVGVASGGQPNQSCQAQPSTPGNSASSPGSAFNQGGTAGSQYAGSQPQNSNNPKSVSQYDVACEQVSQH